MENNHISIKKLVGILFIFLGILGLFLPFLQGLLFITTGLILIGNKKRLDQIKKIYFKVKEYLKNKFNI